MFFVTFWIFFLREYFCGKSRVFHFYFLMVWYSEQSVWCFASKHLVMNVWLKKINFNWFSPHFDVGENLIFGFMWNTDNDKTSIICNEVQKNEERHCSLCAMGKGPFDCATCCMVDNITCTNNEHIENTRSVVICEKFV